MALISEKVKCHPPTKSGYTKGENIIREKTLLPLLRGLLTEKVMLRVHARDTMEEHLGASQFVSREGGSCTNALLSIQFKVNNYLDTQECRADS